ncbi:hypothetical protein HDZ31DRAFT_82172 [Schizophyllum fasciatum]
MLYHALKTLDLASIPDDKTIPQFMLDAHAHRTRPTRGLHAKTWLVHDKSGQHIEVGELEERTYALANALRIRYGIKDDDVDFPVVIWATHYLGAIVSPANPSFTVDELLYQIERTNARVIFAYPEEESLRVAREAAQKMNIPPDHVILLEGDDKRNSDAGTGNTPPGITSFEDLLRLGSHKPRSFKEYRLQGGGARNKIAFLSFSSGTTGKPKECHIYHFAVAIPHYAFIANIVQLAVHNEINEPHYNGCESPVPWGSPSRRFRVGDVCLGDIYGLLMSMAVVVVPTFKYTDMLASIERHKITHLILVPPQAVLLCKHPATDEYRDALTRVRFMLMGAAPVSHEVTTQLVKVLPNAQIGQAYGMTETSTAVSMFPTSQNIGTSGSAGQLLPGVVARVAKTDGSLSGTNEPGELVVSSPSVTLGYYGDKEATRVTYVDGWVRTGDEVRIDEKLEVWVIDRMKEIMKVNGYQVAPAELEGCILNHPAVADCCVVGVRDAYSGEVPLAFVVLAEGAKDQAREEVARGIMQHVATNKVSYKHLKGGIEFIDVIPKNPSGA